MTFTPLQLDRATMLLHRKEGLADMMQAIADGGDVRRAFNMHQEVYMPLAAEYIHLTPEIR
jgi:hypothetical protein